MHVAQQISTPSENLKLNMLTSLEMLICEVSTNPASKPKTKLPRRYLTCRNHLKLERCFLILEYIKSINIQAVVLKEYFHIKKFHKIQKWTTQCIHVFTIKSCGVID